MILTEQAVAAAPLLALVADGHTTPAALAAQLNRDRSNTRKSVLAAEDAGWLGRADKDGALMLTRAGQDVLAALARAAAPELPGTGSDGAILLHLIDEDAELNPRTVFNDQDQADLAASVADKGVLQPILVRPSLTEGRFRVVAGSRRRRAALAAGLSSIPAVVRDLTDAQALEAATIENVQRADMSPLDEARAFQRIIDARMAADPALPLKAAKEAVADVIRKSVRFVELRLQLQELPPIKQVELNEGKISVTDARKWLQSRPQVLDLTDAQWLIVLEVAEFEAQGMEADAAGGDDSDATTCRAPIGAEAGEIADFSGYPNYLITVQTCWRNGVETNLANAGVGYRCDEQIALRFGADVDATARWGLILALREEVLGHAAAKAIGPNGWATPWLNGPFEIDPEIAREIAEKAAKDEAAEARQIEGRAEAQRRAIAAIERAQALKTRSREADFRLADGFGDAVEAAGLRLPVTVSPLGDIVDAEGRQVVRSGWYNPNIPGDLLARYTLIAVALNGAAGLATPEPPTPEPDVAPAIPRTEFVAAVAGLLTEDLDDLPEDDDEALFEATERASRGLDAYLAAEDIDYGDDRYDWDETGAMALAQGIREDGLGQAASDTDAELSPALKRLAGIPAEA